MQQATILYNDRVNTYRRMAAIDAVIDNEGTKSMVMELALLRMRNRQAFNELLELNDNGQFLYRHPLIKDYSLREQLAKMMKSNPGEFLKKFANTRENVKRYSSYLNKKGRTDDQKKRDKANLKKHREHEQLMKEILNEGNGDN